MRDFFRSFFASLLALIVFIILLIILAGGIVSSLSNKLEGTKTRVQPNSILELNLNYAIPEQTQIYSPTDIVFSGLDFTNPLGLNDVLFAINKAKEDNNIKGIYINLGLNMNGYATLQEVRDALTEFESSGKFIVAYGEMVNQASYFVGSVANQMYLNPSGFLEFKGYSATWTFFKGTLDKLNMNVQIFYDGKFKSATEPLRNSEMSEENKTQLREYLVGLYNHNLSQIVNTRGKTIEEYKLIADAFPGWSAYNVLEKGLVDGVKYKDEVIDVLREKIGVGAEVEVPIIKLEDYFSTLTKEQSYRGDNTIAIVYANGDIVDGEGSSSNIGSAAFTKIFEDIRKNKDIKAVVFRVNSPGGSATASDVIWREIEITKKKIPVIVSMGDYAASGGYMISANASKIYAHPNTLTGSIGVFMILPEISEFMDSKLGVTFDTVKTSPYADFPSITRPVSADESVLLQSAVDTVYYNFKKMVANGRGLTMEQVQEIAQGRIWLGITAKELGLVDELGGIDEAIAGAAEMVGLTSYKLKEYPEIKPTLFESIMKSMGSETEVSLMEKNLGILYPHYKTLEQLIERPSMQARLPYTLKIE